MADIKRSQHVIRGMSVMCRSSELAVEELTLKGFTNSKGIIDNNASSISILRYGLVGRRYVRSKR